MIGSAANLERLLAGGQDSAVLRFSLGSAYLETDPERAAHHFESAVVLKPDYSAAWKMLGKAHTAAGNIARALEAYAQGIAVAQAKGDVQAEKEMQIFLKRLSRAPQPPRDR